MPGLFTKGVVKELRSHLGQDCNASLGYGVRLCVRSSEQSFDMCMGMPQGSGNSLSSPSCQPFLPSTGESQWKPMPASLGLGPSREGEAGPNLLNSRNQPHTGKPRVFKQSSI